jgi:hypothetical protein
MSEHRMSESWNPTRTNGTTGAGRLRERLCGGVPHCPSRDAP